MNLFVRVIIISIAVVAVQSFLSWWWMAPVVAFLVEFFLGKGDKLGFFSGFYGVAIPWMILAMYIDSQNDSMLAYRVLDLFSLPRYAMVLIIITGMVGGIAGGLTSLSASWTRSYLNNAK